MAGKLFKPRIAGNTNSPAASRTRWFARRLDVWPVWLAAFLLIYGLSAGSFLWEGTVFNYHAWQASAWLKGHLWLPNVTEEKLDLTPFTGHWYSAFPPLPALVMLPFALIWGNQANQVMVSVALGALNVVLMRQVLNRLAGHVPSALSARIWLTLLFGLGTVVWQSVIQGTVWHLAHTCAVTLLLLALWCGLDEGRLLPVGILVGLAGLARPTAWLALFYWLVVLYRRNSHEHPQAPLSGRLKTLAPGVARLVLGPGLAVGANLTYNRLRFGSFSDFGYAHMLVGQNIRSDLNLYGQFHPHFLAKNFYQAFLSLPQFHTSPPFMVFNLDGNSLLFITPAFLLAGLAFKHIRTSVKTPVKTQVEPGTWWSRTILLAAGLAVLSTLGLLLLYFNTGQIQFGYRFLLDCLPFVMLLVALGWPKRRTGWAIGLVLISIILNFYGMMWYQGWLPEFFGVVKK